MREKFIYFIFFFVDSSWLGCFAFNSTQARSRSQFVKVELKRNLVEKVYLTEKQQQEKKTIMYEYKLKKTKQGKLILFVS